MKRNYVKPQARLVQVNGTVLMAGSYYGKMWPGGPAMPDEPIMPPDPPEDDFLAFN